MRDVYLKKALEFLWDGLLAARAGCDEEDEARFTTAIMSVQNTFGVRLVSINDRHYLHALHAGERWRMRWGAWGA